MISVLSRDALCNPSVCWRTTLPQSYLRLPAQDRAQPRVIAVPSADPLRTRQIMAVLYRLAGDLSHDVDQLIDGHQLVRAEIERQAVVGPHDAKDSLDAIVDVHKRAGLPAIAPDLDFVARSAGGNLAADGSGPLFPAPVVGTYWPRDGVEPAHPVPPSVLPRCA